ncbi:glycosyltransferase [Winogradskyella psychrotolerans]|nr:glycosyltransferase [Winogradskyella psychrotolerans]
MKLSIVIPVYNVEKYITRCIESILDQDLRYSI